MKPRTLIILIISVVLICVVISTITQYYSQKSVSCYEKENIEKIRFNGIITKKFNDFENHNYNALILSEFNMNQSTKLFFINELSRFYDYVSVGDTIVKEYGSLTINKISKKKIFKLKYDCNRP
jgi:hypothetical protein